MSDQEYRTQIGKRLSEIPEAFYGGNKSKFAKAIGTTPQAFHKYYTGDRVPGSIFLKRISELGVSIDWLLTGEGEMIVSKTEIVKEERISPFLLTIEAFVKEQAALVERVRRQFDNTEKLENEAVKQAIRQGIVNYYMDIQESLHRLLKQLPI